MNASVLKILKHLRHINMLVREKIRRVNNSKSVFNRIEDKDLKESESRALKKAVNSVQKNREIFTHNTDFSEIIEKLIVFSDDINFLFLFFFSKSKDSERRKRITII